MASREPLWFCHQCNAEMRPLMMPDPVCASCRGSFVEKIEDPEDDPREFHQAGEGDFPGGRDPFLTLLQGLMNRPNSGNGLRTSPPPRRETSPTSGISFQFSTNSGPGTTRTIQIGGPRTLGRDGPGSPGHRNVEFGRVPTMSEYIGRGGPNTDRDDGGPGITGALMAQYLMAMLGHRGPFPDMLGGDAATQGRMGDYVFNQEALDQIITQLMENSNSSRPVPATEEIVEKLPREVLTEGCAMLEKDCAVCKEQFKLDTEDPDEQVVVTLPCHHPFHEPCIIPWLKSSGTCPVCRHQLVPQPGHSSSPGGDGHNASGSGSGSPPRSQGRSSSPRNNDGGGGTGGGGLFQSLFGMMGGGNHSNNSSGRTNTNSPPASPTRPTHGRSPSDQSNQRRNSRDNHGHNRYLPGSWDSLD